MRVLLCLLGLAALGSAPAAAQITFEPLPFESGAPPPNAPIQGRPVRIHLPQPTESVLVVWRPNSAIPDTVALDPDGTSFVWTPTRAGVATVVTPHGSQNISVRYDRPPATGIFVLFVAGTILFGGAGFALGRLLGSDRTPDELEREVERRPDT